LHVGGISGPKSVTPFGAAQGRLSTSVSAGSGAPTPAKKRPFWSKTGPFGAKKWAKSGVCSYWFVNRLKMHV